MTLSLLIRKLAVLPVRFYQYCISPLFPGCCRFSPTCSAYACEAVLTHGLCKGSLLALWRIARCQPLCRGGFDPVPAPRREKRPGQGPGRATALPPDSPHSALEQESRGLSRFHS
jgi:putative membrane protein insertion efficiency factor